MSIYTDADIPISCGECGFYTEGFDAMIAHVKANHKNYNELETSEYVIRWLEDAYDKLDLEEQEQTERMRGRKLHVRP